MESNEEKQQLEEVRSQLRIALRTPIKESAVRRDTLKRLIDLSHSPYTSLKCLAANNFKYFIKDFPDLEDEAINAVYDLCEDQVSKVRIDGYTAISQVSREQKKWVKRNADVLVQLLQSDEPDEVTVVKKALIEHLDMDAPVTLGVLCDQIVPPELEEHLDEEDQAIRDRLRSLVLAFLAGEAKRGIVERHTGDAEEVLVGGLFKALTKLPQPDIDTIIKEILLSLPSFSRYSSRGAELLSIIISQAQSSLKYDLAQTSANSTASLPTTRYYLDLASFVAIEKRAAAPGPLLRFYCTSMVSKMTLMKLTEEAQVYVLENIARALEACESDEAVSINGADGQAGLKTLRKLVIDACVASLLPCFADLKSEQQRPWKACQTLLEACNRRKTEMGWVLPNNLIAVLAKIQTISEAVQKETRSVVGKASLEEAQNLIRSLLRGTEPMTVSTSTASTSTATSTSNVAAAKPTTATTGEAANGTKGMNKINGSATSSPVIIKRKREEQGLQKPPLSASLPPRPPPSVALPPLLSSSSGQQSAPPGPRAERQQRHGQNNNDQGQGRLRHGGSGGPRTPSGSGRTERGSSPRRKQPHSNENGDRNAGYNTPSLLSRLEGTPFSTLTTPKPASSSTTITTTQPQSQPPRSYASSSIPTKRRAAESEAIGPMTTTAMTSSLSFKRSSPRTHQREPLPDSDVDMDTPPAGGWSIRGAASKVATTANTSLDSSYGRGHQYRSAPSRGGRDNRDRERSGSGSGSISIKGGSLLDRLRNSGEGGGHGGSGGGDSGDSGDRRSKKRTKNM